MASNSQVCNFLHLKGTQDFSILYILGAASYNKGQGEKQQSGRFPNNFDVLIKMAGSEYVIIVTIYRRVST